MVVRPHRVIAKLGVSAYADSVKNGCSQTFSIGHIPVGGGAPLFFIAGPCVIESETHAMGLAEKLAEVSRSLGIPLIFKASYDKANRSSLESFRGPGLQEGLRILRLIGKRTGLAHS
jgi:2-dehydro-3-deoxyphosphooctonate aldolase (KDO 8-P synthase)